MNTRPSHPAADLRQREAHEESQWLSIASRRVANGVPPSGEQRKTKRKDSPRLLVQFVGGGNQRVMSIANHIPYLLRFNNAQSSILLCHSKIKSRENSRGLVPFCAMVIIACPERRT